MPEFAEKKWIFEFQEGSRDLTPKEVVQTYGWVEEHLLPVLNIPKESIAPLGSYGKKNPGQISSDVDIAVCTVGIADPLNTIDAILNENGYQTKKIPGLKQISFCAPLHHLHHIDHGNDSFVQIDLMLTDSLEWAKFAYHSPDYTMYESEYPGAVRTILMMSILSESTRTVLTRDIGGHPIKIESKVIRLPEGIFSTRRTFMGKRGFLKKPKLLKEYDRKVTNDPREAARLILGKDYAPRDLNSFERIWRIINRPDFVHKESLHLIQSRFIRGLQASNLPYPAPFLTNI